MKLWELRDTINALIELHGVNSRIQVIYPCSNRVKLGNITGYEVVRDDREGRSIIKLKINHQASEAMRRARRRTVVEKKSAPVMISGIGAAVRFLRERGVIVWQFDDGRYAVNGREVQPMHILKMANAKRVRAGMPAFELEYSA